MADALFDLLEPTVSGLGYELLGIERARDGVGQILRLYIDRSEGIVVDDCAVVSRQVGDLLDVEDAVRGEYTLEVSSPGVDRPLFTLAQHRRFVGEAVQLRLRNLVNGRRRIEGVLLEVQDDTLVVEVDGEPFEVPYAEVDRARLVTQFNASSGAEADL